MARSITARVMLSRVRQPDTWFGLDWSMNLYRGCQHGCIYCDSRSECYGIDDFTDIQVKTNAIELLHGELARKRMRGTIGTGSMHDPYMPLEREVGLTRRALEVIARHRFSVHILTKSDLVLRDLDVLGRFPSGSAAVSFTVTTADDALAAQVEPGAPVPSCRFVAMRTLADAGITTGVIMMPVLPFIEDTPGNVAAVVDCARAAGASYIIPAFGLTMRDRQREYFYGRLDELFPGLRPRYQQAYGESYSCSCPNARALERHLRELCTAAGIAVAFPAEKVRAGGQSELF